MKVNEWLEELGTAMGVVSIAYIFATILIVAPLTVLNFSHLHLGDHHTETILKITSNLMYVYFLSWSIHLVLVGKPFLENIKVNISLYYEYKVIYAVAYVVALIYMFQSIY